ncbi:ABC transporter permease [Stratiformator vulcanicus]|uniref:Transport permease protein n=1 Tax=Stratiformator vulcanicus TaxID=2527980 RepID=A0A517R3V1_9PLAN|nr:ABC transporter permease [Stratiformator vulcanicus]QDT38565.1 ABC-2 type transporter [Stratiformator vulcanicus]
MSAPAPPEDAVATVDAPVENSKTEAPEYAAVWLPAWSLAVRELVRFFRQRTRVIGAVGQPVVFWILLGAGLHGSFEPPEWAPAEMTYQEFFFPGIAVLIILFTAIFSTISIIEDRREGFLQGVLVAPVPRISIVMGKVGGGAAIAILQATIFLIVGPLLSLVGLAPGLELSVSLSVIPATLAMLVVIAVGLTALGYCLAWPMESTQGYHAVMSVFLLPMWLLSGSFFPASSGWLGWVVFLNPLSYGVAGLRRAMYPAGTLGEAAGLPSGPICAAVSVGFAVVCMGVAVWLSNRRTTTDLR